MSEQILTNRTPWQLFSSNPNDSSSTMRKSRNVFALHCKCILKEDYSSKSNINIITIISIKKSNNTLRRLKNCISHCLDFHHSSQISQRNKPLTQGSASRLSSVSCAVCNPDSESRLGSASARALMTKQRNLLKHVPFCKISDQHVASFTPKINCKGLQTQSSTRNYAVAYVGVWIRCTALCIRCRTVVMSKGIRNQFYRKDSFKRVEWIDSQGGMSLQFENSRALCRLFYFFLSPYWQINLWFLLIRNSVMFRYDILPAKIC